MPSSPFSAFLGPPYPAPALMPSLSSLQAWVSISWGPVAYWPPSVKPREGGRNPHFLLPVLLCDAARQGSSRGAGEWHSPAHPVPSAYWKDRVSHHWYLLPRRPGPAESWGVRAWGRTPPPPQKVLAPKGTCEESWLQR